MCSRISPCLPQQAKQLKVSPDSFLPCCRAMYTLHLKPTSSPETHPAGSVEPFGTASTQNLQIPNSLLHSRLYIPSPGRHRNTDLFIFEGQCTPALRSRFQPLPPAAHCEQGEHNSAVQGSPGLIGSKQKSHKSICSKHYKIDFFFKVTV